MKNNKGFIGMGIIIAIIAVLAVGGIAYYVGKKSNTLPKVEQNNLPEANQNDIANVPTPTPTPTPSPTPATACLPSTTPWLKVLSPNGGETYTVGQTITVKWKNCNVSSSSNNIVVALHQNGDWQNVVFLSEATINDGSQTFTIPTVTPGSYKIRVGSASANVQQDFSDNLFTINTKSVTPTPKSTCTSTSPTLPIKVLSPNGGEVFHVGDVMKIKWEGCNFPNPGASLGIFLIDTRVTYGPSDLLVASAISINNDNYNFTIPSSIFTYGHANILDGQNSYKIWIMDGMVGGGGGHSDTSDVPFTILPATSVLQTIYSHYQNGEISECTYQGASYYTAGINAYDGGQATYDMSGNIVGSSGGITGQATGIQPTNCTRIYAVYPNIWGYPAINTYNLH